MTHSLLRVNNVDEGRVCTSSRVVGTNGALLVQKKRRGDTETRLSHQFHLLRLPLLPFFRYPLRFDCLPEPLLLLLLLLTLQCLLLTRELRLVHSKWKQKAHIRFAHTQCNVSQVNVNRRTQTLASRIILVVEINATILMCITQQHKLLLMVQTK